MKINYLQFMKHAAKVTKQVDSRPILAGVNHTEEGDLVCTDSHRLYKVHHSLVNAPKNVVINPETGEEVNFGNYPNTDSLIPHLEEATAKAKITDLNKAIKLLKAMQQAGMAEGEKKDSITVSYDDTGSIKLDLEKETTVFFGFHIENLIPMKDKIIFSLTYLLEALEMMQAQKVQFVNLYFYGNDRAFLITPDFTDKLLAMILPIRRF